MGALVGRWAVVVGALLLPAVTPTSPARAQPNVDAREPPPPGSPSEPASVCLTAFDQGQALRAEGKLRAAREEFARCALADCIDVVRTKCSIWLQELDRDIPTAILTLADHRGRLTNDPRVFVDGRLAPEAAAGRAQGFDPGPHTVRVELPDGRSLDAQFTLLQGAKNQVIELRFPPPPPTSVPAAPPPPFQAPAAPPLAPPVEPEEETPILGYVLLGVGAAGLGLGVGFTVDAMAARDEAESLCPESPGLRVCSAEAKDALERDLTNSVVADVSFGVGIAAAATGLLLVLLSAASDEEAVETSRIWVTPLVGGGELGLLGRF